MYEWSSLQLQMWNAAGEAGPLHVDAAHASRQSGGVRVALGHATQGYGEATHQGNARPSKAQKASRNAHTS